MTPPDWKAMWRKLRAGGMSADQANDTVHEHMRRLATVAASDTQDAPQQNAALTAITQFGHGASFGFAGDPSYLAEGEAANPETAKWAGRAGSLAGGTAALANPASIALLSGLSPAAAAAAGGAVVGGLEGAGNSDPGNRTFGGVVGAIGGGVLGGVGGKVAGKFLPTGKRLAANLVKLLGAKGSTVPGLQSVADLIERESVGPAVAGRAPAAGVSPADVEELAHVLRGEPTMPGYQTTSAWIGSEAPPAVAGAAPGVMSEAEVRANLQEAAVQDLADKLMKGGVGVDNLPGLGATGTNRATAEAAARRMLRVAGAHAVRDTRLAAMPVAQGSTPVMHIEGAAPQIPPDVAAAHAERAAAFGAQQQAATETAQARLAARLGQPARGTPTPAQTEAAAASLQSRTGPVVTGPGMGRAPADYNTPPDIGAGQSDEMLKARARIFMQDGFSQADAREMAAGGMQAPRARLERILGKRLPASMGKKWI